MASTNVPPDNNQVTSRRRTNETPEGNQPISQRGTNPIRNGNQPISQNGTNYIRTGNQPISQEKTNEVKNGNQPVSQNGTNSVISGNWVNPPIYGENGFINNNSPTGNQPSYDNEGKVKPYTNPVIDNNYVPETTVRKPMTGTGYKSEAAHLESVYNNGSTTIKPTSKNGITGMKPKIILSDLTSDKEIQKLLHAANIYSRSEIEWYTKFNRFGCLDPYNGVTNTREYLFFTKPDLHICEPGSEYLQLNPQLQNNGFFVELVNRYPNVVRQLQKSTVKEKDVAYTPFMNVLSNSVKNSLELPEIESGLIDTAATIFGTSIEYRGDGFSSDEKHQFSLEFEDTRYLEIYILLKAYEEYERAKKVGLVSPPNIDLAPTSDNALDGSGYPISHNVYIRERRLHDQFSIYKFIVDEDYETLLYYAVLKGVTFMNVPRGAFSDLKVDGGLRYNVSMKAQFVDDMKPWILVEFNNLIKNTMAMSQNPTMLPIYDTDRGIIDGRWAKIPYIYRQNNTGDPKNWTAPTNMSYLYKLKWRLS